MPSVSLVVCLYQQRDLLERLLGQSAGLYDDLVVVHDGPEEIPKSNARIFRSGDQAKPPALDFSELPENSPLPKGYVAPSISPMQGSIDELVARHGGKYYWGPRCFQQEPHWPFAWSRAKYDWILRLDTDEFPSAEMAQWLRDFRKGTEPPDEVSGYTCIWPLWNGRKTVTKRWPGGRIFFFHRRRVSFFGVVEQVPIPDSRYQPLDLILYHQPKRKSYGVRNILFRRQAYDWRRVIAYSLLAKPTALPRWRWASEQWPARWEYIRSHPIRHAFDSLVWSPLRQFRDMLSCRELPRPSACLNPALHHFMIGFRVLLAKCQQRQ